MFLRIKKLLIFSFFVSALLACSEYSKVMKSTDLEYKFKMGVKYYEAGKYNKAFPIFDELSNLYRGTQQGQEVYYYYAMTNYKLNDYLLAGYHFKNFYKTFPRHPKAEEATYLTGLCYYKESPPYSLDQAYTFKAINELQLFVNAYPNSELLEEANTYIIELRKKLERKAFETAKQYYTINQYQAAVVALSNVVNDFPDTQYREEIGYTLILSSFELARNSIESKKLQRFIETNTACNDYLERFATNKNATEVKEIQRQVTEQINLLKSQS
jgi:outer membrane protein assembly factor BamD